MGKKPKRTVIGERKVCIFCNRPNAQVSKEHIWPQWMHPLFGPTAPTHDTTTTHLTGGRRIAEITRWKRNGPMYTMTIRAVCGDCNSVWMSGLDNAVIPYVGKMMTGSPLTLTSGIQKLVAEWIALKILTYEHVTNIGPARKVAVTTPVYGQDVRDKFMASRQMPPGFRIWIGRGGGPKWHINIYRHAAYMMILEEGVSPPSFPPGDPRKTGATPNVQAVTWGIGDLLVFVIATSDPNIYEETRWRLPPGFKSLWPLSGADIVWPSNIALLDTTIDDVSDTLRRLIPNPPAR